MCIHTYLVSDGLVLANGYKASHWLSHDRYQYTILCSSATDRYATIVTECRERREMIEGERKSRYM